MPSAYNVKKLKDTHINWSAMHTNLNLGYEANIKQALVFKHIISWEVYVLFRYRLPLKEVLVVCFPEGTRCQGTGTGGMVV